MILPNYMSKPRNVFYSIYRNISAVTNRSKVKQPTGLILLIVPVTTFCLGTWQVKRRKWKLNLIEEVESKHAAEPVFLPDDLEQILKMEYQRVKVKGKFDHSKELYIGPRNLLKKEKNNNSLFSSQPNSGYLVVTPFFLSDKNYSILVNRGWVPKSKQDPSKRKEGQVADEVELVGTVRLPEKRPQFSPKHKEDTKQFFYRDVPKMIEITGALPIFLDAETSVKGGPIGSQTRISFRNDHLSYIITWYSLSAATAYIWYKKYFSRVKSLIT